MLQGKLLKREGAPLSELERQVSKALTDLQVSSEIKHQLAELYIVGVKEVQVGSKAAILIYVPVPLLRSFQKIQVRLVRELEKKFGGKHILFLAKRRILPKPLRGSKRVPLKQKRPISRTKTAVHDAWLNELVFPADVVGRRIRIKFDGSKVHKIHLDKGNQTNVEHRIEAFTTVYKKLTGKDVVFEFPEPLC